MSAAAAAQLQQTNEAALAQQQLFQQEIVTVRRQHYELQQQLHLAQGALQQAPQAAPARAMGIRIPAPPAYDGTSPPLDEWLAKMQQQFDYYNHESDSLRVHAGAASIAGPALDWWQQLVKIDDAPSKWGDFVEALRARFQPVTTERVARNELSALKQGRSAISVYVARFRTLLGRIPNMDAATQLHQFEQGLNEDLYKQLQAYHPSTLMEAINTSMRMGTSSHRGGGGDSMDLNMISGDGNGGLSTEQQDSQLPVTHTQLLAILAAHNKNPHGNRRFAPGASGGSTGPRGLPTITGLTPAQVKKFMEEGRCFTCHEIGHVSRGCPNRSSSAPRKKGE